MNNLISDPADWQPAAVTELIGPAMLVGRALLAKAQRPGTGGIRALLTGAQGLGKTSICLLVAKALATHPAEIERISGKDVNAERVRQWMAELPYRPMYGGRAVKLIEELDKCTPDGVVLLLQYLDLAKDQPHRAVLANSNVPVDKMEPRLQSRFQHFPITGPAPREIQTFLQGRCAIPCTKARILSEQCGGDVRAALNDAQSWLDIMRAGNATLAA